MIFSIITYAGLAAAVPLVARQASLPPVSRGSGFHLIANITSGAKLEEPRWTSLQHVPMTSPRTGPESHLLGLSPGANPGATLWQNDTTHGRDESQVLRFKNAILMDGYRVAEPVVLMADEARDHHQRAVFGHGDLGTEGISIADGAVVARMMFPDNKVEWMSLVVCDYGFDGPDHPQFRIGVQHQTPYEGPLDEFIPEDCAPLNLIPQCAELPDMYDTALYTREFLMEVPCYEDVAAIDWSKY